MLHRKKMKKSSEVGNHQDGPKEKHFIRDRVAVALLRTALGEKESSRNHAISASKERRLKKTQTK